MTIELDHERRRVNIAATPGFSGARVSQAIVEMFEHEPDLASYDFVMDMRASVTGATQADIDIVLRSYHQQPREPGPKYGCFVTSDPHFHLWTAAMDDLFGDRRNLVFGTPEAANSFLDQLRVSEPTRPPG